MDFDKLAYPEIIYIDGQEYAARRDVNKGTVSIPYSDEPDVGIGDDITQKSGRREISLKVLDASFLEGGSLKVGTKHPHVVTLKVENITAQAHKTPAHPSTINIGSVSGQQVQVGNNNAQTVNVTIEQLSKEILTSIAQGKKSFSLSGDSSGEIEEFQEIAKFLIHCDNQGWFDSIKPHKSMRTGRQLYDLVFIPNGLSYSGTQYLESLSSGATHSNAPQEDIIDLKPNFMGIGININALVRWWKNKK